MSRWFRALTPLLAAAVVLGAGTAAATKAINGKSIKNGTISEKKLSASVRNKLNAPGPQGPQGPPGQQGAQGIPGNPAPAGKTAVAQNDAIPALALNTSAVILALDSAQGTGPLTVDGPSRLLITAQVNASKTSSNFDKTARVACRLQHKDGTTIRLLGRRVEATMIPLDNPGALTVSLALVGSADVDSGPQDVSVSCESSAAPPANAGVSVLSASLNVNAVPR